MEVQRLRLRFTPGPVPGPVQRWVQPSLTWPCFRDAMLAYRGTQARLALVFATASETAPMAMLPWRMGSGGSGGMMGFSKRVSLRPGEENRNKGFVSRSLTVIKSHLLRMLHSQKTQHRRKGGVKVGLLPLSSQGFSDLHP